MGKVAASLPYDVTSSINFNVWVGSIDLDRCINFELLGKHMYMHQQLLIFTKFRVSSEY